MSEVTVASLAKVLGMPTEKLLEQLAGAGMTFSGPDQVVSSTEKMKLLGFLRRTHGKEEAPADNAVVTVLGATSATAGTLATTVTPQSLLYHPDAFAMVMADLHKPSSGAETTSVRSKELGISIRMVQQYQIGTDQEPTRMDILYGWATLREPIVPAGGI